MDSTLNTSNETNNGIKETKRQQFSNKQRMDMYAFCVLELEMHSNKVSIKKQQQAIQKVLYEQQRSGQAPTLASPSQNQQLSLPDSQISLIPSSNQSLTKGENDINVQIHNQLPQMQHPQLHDSISRHIKIDASEHQQPLSIQSEQITQPTLIAIIPSQQIQPATQQSVASLKNGEPSEQMQNHDCNQSGIGKTLLQLQQEVELTRKCYSDYQRTQVLTSSMLRDVQKRFAKYYPDSAIPSRTTIKHVFEKCVSHGTVENIKTPRKATKIPQGDEIEYLLIHEPQLSLRQMAQKLNVSTGTVSRRCKALGLIPESVTIKHQQLATARRQKQIKQLESQNKTKNQAN